MNIYLDIDGVILGTASPAEDVEALMHYILDHFPRSVYWLTTHCKGRINRTKEWLEGQVSDVLAERLYREVLPTDWNTMKTEAIDFSAPFLWLDDALLYTERKTSQDQGKLESWLVMNKRDPNMAKKALDRIRQFAG